MKRRITAVLILLVAALSCSRDPDTVKRKYLQSGNKYFDKGQYKEASIMYRQALRKDQKYGEAYYRLALTEVRLGQIGNAVRALRRATELMKDHVESRVQLADIFLGALLMSDRNNAKQVSSLRGELETVAKQLLDRDPKSMHGLRYEGYLLLFDNKQKEAIAKFQAANAVAPGRPEVILPLTQALFSDGQKEEAERTAKAAVEKNPKFSPLYDILFVHYIKQQRSSDAEQILKQKAQNLPQQAGPVLQLASFYYGMKRPQEAQAALARLTADLKTFPNAYGDIGQFYRQRGEHDRALAALDEGIQKQPKQKTLLLKRKAQTLLDAGRRNEAAGILDEVLKADSKDTEAQVMRASLRIETGTKEEVQTAISELQNSVSQRPKDHILRFNLGRALLRKGEIEQARTQFREAVKIQPNYIPPQLMLAEIHGTKREFPQALQTIAHVLEIEPGNLIAKLLRVGVYLRMGNLDEARKNLEVAIKEHPNSREAVLQLAGLDLVQKRYKEAEATFLKLKESAAPGDLRSLLGLSEVYASQGNFEKAQQVLRGELAGRDVPGIRLALANVAVRAKQYDTALAELQKLVERNPKGGPLYLRIGEVQRRMGDVKAAITNYRKATELMPNDAASRVALALALDFAGQRGEAKTVYEQILRLQPDHVVALNNLAYLMAETGADLDEALRHAERAKQKLPHDPNVADTLGWIYIKKNLSDNAIQIFRDLIKQQPQMSTFHYHLGMALYQKGDKPEARRALERALQLKPPADETLKIKELISKLG